MLPPPKKLSNENGLTRWLNHVVQWAGQFLIIESPDIKPSIGPNGTTLKIKTRGGSAGAPSAFRGEWKNDRDYTEGDLVIRGSNNEASAAWNDAETILRDGTQAGLFRARGAVPPGESPPGEPDDSGWWETMARFSTPVFAVKKDGYDNKVTLDSTSPSQASVTIDGPAIGQTINLVANGPGTVDLVTADLGGRRAYFQRICVKVGGMNKSAFVLMTNPE